MALVPEAVQVETEASQEAEAGQEAAEAGRAVVVDRVARAQEVV